MALEFGLSECQRCYRMRVLAENGYEDVVACIKVESDRAFLKVLGRRVVLRPGQYIRLDDDAGPYRLSDDVQKHLGVERPDKEDE